MERFARKARLLTAAATALMVVACDDRRAVDAPPPAPLAELQGLSELPYAEPAQVDYAESGEAYAYAERAYGVQRAFYETPPDYGFEYDDVTPYVWESSDDWTLYAEPYEGDYRYYYYEPGAAYPYFVRDGDYGYAYGAAGALIAMFYPDGRYAPSDVVYRAAPLAGRYYARGHNLRRAARATQRVQVDDRRWVEEAPRVTRSAGPWLRAARDDREWRAWRERDGDRELRRFEAEARRRQDAAQAWRARVDRQEVATVERREAPRGKAPREDQQVVQDQRRERGQGPLDAGRPPGSEPRRSDDRQAQAVRERQQQQGEARRAEQAQRRQAEAQQRQQAQAERRQPARRDAERPPQQAKRPPARTEQPQARAPSAGERGRPAAAREEGGREARGKGHGQDKPDRGGERRKD